MSNIINALGFNWNSAVKPLPPMQTAPPDPILPHYNSSMWNPDNVFVEDGMLCMQIAQNSGYVYDINTQQYLPYNPNKQEPQDPDAPNNNYQEWASSRMELVIPSGKMLSYGKYTVTLKALGTANPVRNWKFFFRENFNIQLGIQIRNSQPVYDYQTSKDFELINLGCKNMNPRSPESWISQQPGGPKISNAQMSMQPWRNPNGTIRWDNLKRIRIEPKKMSADGLITIASDWQSDQVPVKTYAAYGDYNSENFPYSDPDTITWQSAAASQQHVPTADDTATFWMSLFSWGVPGSRMAVKFGMTNICMPEFSDKPA